MEPRVMIGSNLDTCSRGYPLMKLVGYEHREDTVGVQSMANTHTHTLTESLVIHRWMEPRAMIGSNLDTCNHFPPTN